MDEEVPVSYEDDRLKEKIEEQKRELMARITEVIVDSRSGLLRSACHAMMCFVIGAGYMVNVIGAWNTNRVQFVYAFGSMVTWWGGSLLFLWLTYRNKKRIDEMWEMWLNL